MEVIKLFSEYKVVISESDSDTIDAKFVICDFGYNKNDVMLNRATIEDWYKTIEIKPLVGKVAKKMNGTSDFTGHNVKIVKKVDEDGNEYNDVEFDTSAFGSFYESKIETIDDKEVITASAKVWKRFTQAYEVIKRRANTDIGIKTSWEIQVKESHYENIDGKRIKVIDKGIFIGHALLGESIEPAYDSSGLLQVASQILVDNELAEALALDMISHSQENLQKEDIIVPTKDKEVSALTVRDLYQKVQAGLNPKGWNSNPYYSVWEIFPEDHKILAYDIERESEDTYLSISYTVAENDITIGEKVETKLSKLLSEKTNVSINLDMNQTAQLLSTKEGEIKELSTKNAELSTELEQKTNALVEAGSQIETLQSTVDELAPFKAQIAEIERVKLEAETAEKVATLKKLATIGGYISDEEVETSEAIKSLIDSLDEKGIKAIIAERVIDKLNKDAEKVATTPVVVSSTSSNVRTNIDENEDVIDHKAVMSSFLKN